ncbi:hypothetical protein K7432_011396 [Basidiobolus ranarum]|uniref:Uncharacterized protein n=1 Tax=Basidiobolus ranarum TaxID=34480 RepID=A0ABR2VTX5_9FUNG
MPPNNHYVSSAFTGCPFGASLGLSSGIEYQHVEELGPNCSSVPTLLDLFSERMIEVLVDRFYKYNLRDRHIKQFFKGVNMEHLKWMMTKYLLHILGGKPYNGRSMRAAHKRLLDLKDKHFDCILKNLTKAMKDIKLSDPVIKLILSSAESTRNDVLGK